MILFFQLILSSSLHNHSRRDHHHYYHHHHHCHHHLCQHHLNFLKQLVDSYVFKSLFLFFLFSLSVPAYYQGQKFVTRFDPVTYVKITEQMDAHNVGHDRGKVAVADVFTEFVLLRSRLHIRIILPVLVQNKLPEQCTVKESISVIFLSWCWHTWRFIVAPTALIGYDGHYRMVVAVAACFAVYHTFPSFSFH